jgi:hypothetical protein
MGSSVGMKLKKKQPATASGAQFERALMELEDICQDIQTGQFTHGKEDIDRLYWQQKLKNLAMPISLALAEYKGPRVFHHHYKHKESDEQVLTPVLESSRDNLVNACTRALHECENMNGMKGSKLVEEKRLFCKSLRQVLITS